MPELIKPFALDKTGVISLVAPAKRIDPSQYEGFKAHFLALGYEIADLTGNPASHLYFSGLDEERASRFQKGCSSQMAWCVRGGYGTMRLLDQIDFEAIRRAPPILMGMSDITALHLAFQKRGIVSFLGPMANAVLADPRNPEHALQAISSKRPVEIFFPEGEVIRGGVCEGAVVGGNLSILVALMGTAWEIDCRKKILLLEDVNEEPYRIDRMLCQLRLSGKLTEAAGVILASWSGCVPKDSSIGLELREVFDSYFKDSPCPVVLGFPSGHEPFQATIPLGCKARLDLNCKSLKFLELGVSFPEK